MLARNLTNQHYVKEIIKQRKKQLHTLSGEKKCFEKKFETVTEIFPKHI